MHSVTTVKETHAQIPEGYESWCQGFRRFDYARRSSGSVHMNAGMSYLDPAGMIAPHLHSFEESFFVVQGEVITRIGEKTLRLGPGDFGWIGTGTPHAWRAGKTGAQWLEMQSPQPRPAAIGRDTFFAAGEPPSEGESPDGGEVPGGLVGHFAEAELPQPGARSEMEGFNPTTGVAIKMFVDRSRGAYHQSLFLIQYLPGAQIDPHDHTFEESYFIMSGEVEAIADGERHRLTQGDAIWTSVGCVHSFANLGDQPVRWLETQAPLPPAKEVFRFERDWAKYT